MDERADDGVGGAEDEGGVDDEALPHGFRPEAVGRGDDGRRHLAHGRLGEQRRQGNGAQVDDEHLLVPPRAARVRAGELADADGLHDLHADGLGLLGIQRRVDDLTDVAEALCPDEVSIEVVAAEVGVHCLVEELLAVQFLGHDVGGVLAAPDADALVRLHCLLDHGLVGTLVVGHHAMEDSDPRVGVKLRHQRRVRELRHDDALQLRRLRGGELTSLEHRLVERHLQRREQLVVLRGAHDD
mmetsp:Transcript_24099/g.81249  ORF Transcript_24099/g.81249 Transcript_24099/m.81249 type:complete len:242 (-) Transcript_24099:55-780(-)